MAPKTPRCHWSNASKPARRVLGSPAHGKSWPPAVYTACQDMGLMFFGVLGKGMLYVMPVSGPYPCPQLKCKSPNSFWWINQCENHSGSLGLRNLQVTAPSPLKRSLCCFDFQAALDSSVQITPRKTPQRRSGIGEDLRNAQPLEERLFQLEQRIKNEAGRPLRRAVFFFCFVLFFLDSMSESGELRLMTICASTVIIGMSLLVT